MSCGSQTRFSNKGVLTLIRGDALGCKQKKGADQPIKGAYWPNKWALPVKCCFHRVGETLKYRQLQLSLYITIRGLIAFLTVKSNLSLYK